MSQKLFTGLMLLAGVLVLGYVSGVRADKITSVPEATAPEAAATQEVKGKFLAVTIGTAGEDILVLESPRISKLGSDQSFLGGKSLGGTGNVGWNKGAVVWLPFKEIKQIAEYESLDSLKKVIHLD